MSLGRDRGPAAWRPLLRLAWREVRRGGARSVLAVVLIGLPVLAVTAAATVAATQDVSPAEGVDRRLGSADAAITLHEGPVAQLPDPELGLGEGSRPAGFRPPTTDDLRELLGADVRMLEYRRDDREVRFEEGSTYARVVEVDLRDPLADGLAELLEGRLPAAAGEAVVTSALVERGYAPGDRLEFASEETLQVVGVVRDATDRTSPVIHTAPGSLTFDEHHPGSWLVRTAAPVSWDDVRALNERGVGVLSRAVMIDPPEESELDPEMQGWVGERDPTVVLALVLVVTMVLLEVVLLAGPAFAVTVRRQSRTLALLAASGGTPRQARRAILALALVLGGVAVALGVPGGVLLAAVAGVPLAQRFSSTFFGPFEVPLVPVLLTAGGGLLAAVLAALVPAILASRTDVVAVLAGRRGDARPSVRSPLLGMLLLGLGVAGAVIGARRSEGAELWIAASAVVSVLGMIGLVPVVLALLARGAGRLPLAGRYALRDAVRHRTRTVPAVAAVAATVAGVVTLGIALSSDSAQEEDLYQPLLGHDMAAVAAWGEGVRPDWDRLTEVVAREAPDATVSEVRGVPDEPGLEVRYRLDSGLQSWELVAEVRNGLGAVHLVADRIPAAVSLDDRAREVADRALADGRVVVFSARDVEAEQVRLSAVRWDDEGGRQRVVPPTRRPVEVVRIEKRAAPVATVVPSDVAEEIGLPSATTALVLGGPPVSKDVEERLADATLGVDSSASVYVERGFERDEEDAIALAVLAALGGVLMLGGTLTATFLALSDARPDLATLAAVGATPRTRRAVAAAYALVVGGVGAVLGAVVGFVPGIAVSYPLTTVQSHWDPGATQIGPFLSIPWALIGVLVVGLPLLTAAVVGLSARSRMPMAARLD